MRIAVIGAGVWARPASGLIMARHADAVSGEMLNVVEDLRMIVRFEPGSAPDLEALWAAVTAAVFR